jgi:hypothetical protein
MMRQLADVRWHAVWNHLWWGPVRGPSSLWGTAMLSSEKVFFGAYEIMYLISWGWSTRTKQTQFILVEGNTCTNFMKSSILLLMWSTQDRRQGVYWTSCRRCNAGSGTVLNSSTSPWWSKLSMRHKICETYQ